MFRKTIETGLLLVGGVLYGALIVSPVVGAVAGGILHGILGVGVVAGAGIGLLAGPVGALAALAASYVVLHPIKKMLDAQEDDQKYYVRQESPVSSGITSLSLKKIFHGQPFKKAYKAPPVSSTKPEKHKP
ncbi:MAG: hypothetical protein HY052_05985 [Proteobacteria bacterium]|nr:hypothetical protein [Pseudomonadota bacterium]